MAAKMLLGRLRDGVKIFLGPLRLALAAADSYISVYGGATEYVALDTESYTPPPAIAIFEGDDVSDQVEVTGTVNTSEVGVYTLTYTVPGTVPLLSIEHTVIVYDPSSVDAGQAGNIDGLIFTDIIEPVIFTLD